MPDETNKCYLDDNGYYRFKSNGELVHRWVARKMIYLPNRKQYPLPFFKYEIHHVNGNKRDNREDNLQILTQGQHETLHTCIELGKLGKAINRTSFRMMKHIFRIKF